MRDDVLRGEPAALAAILRDTEAIGFGMASEPRTGSLLRMLAASKPGGRLLELGTGTGVATAWLLDGMDLTSQLDTIDNDEAAQSVARRHLGRDSRARFHLADGSLWLREWGEAPFDLIFADAWPGKYTDLELALGILAPGGLYVVDDLLPQPNWPEGHATRVEPLLAELEQRNGLVCVRLAWASGLAIAARRTEQSVRANRPRD